MRSTLAHLYIITSRVLTIYNIIFDTQDITIYCSAPFFPLSLSALGKPKAFSAKRFQLYFIVSRPRHATAGFTFRYVFLVYAPLRSHVYFWQIHYILAYPDSRLHIYVKCAFLLKVVYSVLRRHLPFYSEVEEQMQKRGYAKGWYLLRFRFEGNIPN